MGVRRAEAIGRSGAIRLAEDEILAKPNFHRTKLLRAAGLGISVSVAFFSDFGEVQTVDALLTQQRNADFLCCFAQVFVKRRQRQVAPDGQFEVDSVVAG